MNAVEGRQPGVLNIPGVGAIRFDQWIQDGIYDNRTLATSIPAGTEYEFFSTLTNKNKADTNLAEANKLTEGWEMIITRMGLWITPRSANATSSIIPADDFFNICENSYLKFETGNSKVRRIGPTWAWPPGMGLTGMKAQDETASGPIYRSVLNIGAPCDAAVPKLLVPIRLTNQLHFKVTMRFDDATTLTQTTEVFFVCKGYISRPVM